LDIRKITGVFSVSPQIAESDIAAIAAEGFKAIINNRPDGETPDQPNHVAIRDAVQQAGLAYRHIPIVSGTLTEASVQAMRDALAEVEGPVLAFCRSGTRSTTLWALAEADVRDAAVIIELAAQAGYDLEPMRGVLDIRAKAARR
jgi:sulfide:quinone oxidoreductase